MECFAEFVCQIRFIGECCGGDDPGPPPGGASWDDNTPWDNGIYWS